MNIKKMFLSVLVLATVSFSLATSVTAQADNDCSSGSFKCGYGQTWTCCNSGDRCCSYTGTDDQTWYTCAVPGQSCP